LAELIVVPIIEVKNRRKKGETLHSSRCVAMIVPSSHCIFRRRPVANTEAAALEPL
jgi:hypothetical protein